MGQTNQSNVLIPELFEQAVQGAFANQNAFMGSAAAAAGVVSINGTFPYSSPEHIGNTVSVPYFSSIGEFTALSDGAAAATVALSQTKESATVTRGSLAFEVTRWARSGVAGINGRDIYQEAAEQVLQSATRYMDSLIITASVSGSNQLVMDKFSTSAPRNLDWDLLVDGLTMFGDFQDDVAAVAISSRTKADLLKMKDSQGRPMLVDVANGTSFRLMGYPVIVSDKLPYDNSGMSAVTSSGTTPPVITVSQTANAMGGTGPERPVDLQIKCTTLGARGTWKFSISIDGGATFSAADGYTSAASVALVDPLNPTTGALLGLTLTINTGTAATDNLWSAKSILKHTSLLLKRNALTFWYARSALGLATIPVPQADSVIGAVHMYGAAYRYQRLNGQPFPGVVKIRHNAAGL